MNNVKEQTLETWKISFLKVGPMHLTDFCHQGKVYRWSSPIRIHVSGCDDRMLGPRFSPIHLRWLNAVQPNAFILLNHNKPFIGSLPVVMHQNLIPSSLYASRNLHSKFEIICLRWNTISTRYLGTVSSLTWCGSRRKRGNILLSEIQSQPVDDWFSSR